MARGDIHLETGTTCRAQSDETCPYGGGHVESLEDYASYYNVDATTLKGLVENAKMAPKAALELMGSGEMVDTPPAATRANTELITMEMELATRDFESKMSSFRQSGSDRIPTLEDFNSVPEGLDQDAYNRTIAGLIAERSEQKSYDEQMTEYKIAMVEYENRMLANYEAALQAHRASPFAPRPEAPPFRTVYPKSFEAYDELPKDFLSDEAPAEIASQTAGADLWQEYLRKRKQLGDVAHARGDAPGKIYYL